MPHCWNACLCHYRLLGLVMTLTFDLWPWKPFSNAQRIYLLMNVKPSCCQCHRLLKFFVHSRRPWLLLDLTLHSCTQSINQSTRRFLKWPEQQLLPLPLRVSQEKTVTEHHRDGTGRDGTGLVEQIMFELTAKIWQRNSWNDVIGQADPALGSGKWESSTADSRYFQ